MFKKIFCVILGLSLIGVAGCSLASKASQTTSTTASASVEKVRETTISNTWAMKQLQINLTKELSIELKLKDGDRVDGYFYVIKGDITSFNIYGNTLIYTSTVTDTETKRITSDRISFYASAAQGVSYTLTFNTAASATTIFLELIYPSTDSLYLPYGTK